MFAQNSSTVDYSIYNLSHMSLDETPYFEQALLIASLGSNPYAISLKTNAIINVHIYYSPSNY